MTVHAVPMQRRIGSAGARWLVAAVPAVFVAVLFVWPMLAIVSRGLAPEGHLDPDAAWRVLTDPEFVHAAWFTLWQATLSTLLTLVLGIPGAYVFARYEFRGRRGFQAGLTVAFVLPTVVVALAFRMLLRPFGLSSGVFAILAAHVFFNYVVVVRIVGGVWRNLDPRPVEAARTLGATRAGAFREVTLAALAPAIASAAAITFLFTFTSFGIVLLLGGPQYATIEVMIWRAWTQDLDPAAATTMALVQVVAVAAVLVVSGRFERRRSRALTLAPQASTAHRARTLHARVVVASNLAVPVVLVGVPLAVLVVRSFAAASGGWGFGAYRSLVHGPAGSALAVAPIEAVRNSIVFAAVATLVAVGVGLCAAVVIVHPGRHSRGGGVLDVVLMLPLAASAVTIALGFLLAFDRPPFDWRTSPALIPLAHALVALPFVVRLVTPVLRSIDQRLRDAAATLGASPRRVWREVDLPMVWRAVVVAAGFAFAVSLGEFGATLFLARPDLPTMPVAIARLLSRPGPSNLAQALALGVVLMILTGTVVAALESVRTRDLGEF